MECKTVGITKDNEKTASLFAIMDEKRIVSLPDDE